MAKKKDTSRYAFRTMPDGSYEAAKMDKDGNGLDVYKINKTGSSCSCPAHVPFCRHKQMLAVFKAAGRLDTGWTYDHDTKQWFEPQALGGLLADLFEEPTADTDTQSGLISI